MPNPRPWILALPLVLMLSSCGGGGTADVDPRREPLAAPGTWVVIGSSSAAGVGAPTGQGWVDLVAARWHTAGIVVEPLARVGLRTTQVLPLGAAVPPGAPGPEATVNIDAALARSPALLMLSLPSNDAAARVPAAQTVGHWQQIAGIAAEAAVPTLVLGTQPRGAFDAAQREILAETDRLAATAFGACHVPLFDALAGPGGALAPEVRSPDGDHLNAEGHARVAARVTAALASGRCVRVQP
jgi:lysophospholipase L1-like esterase